MKLTIDRSTWLRGEGPNASRLLREADGKMCCVGFLGLACGLTKEQLLEKTTVAQLVKTAAYKPSPEHPVSLDDMYRPHFDFVRGLTVAANSDVANDLYNANDETLISEATRETSLAVLFAKIGVEVEFV